MWYFKQLNPVKKHSGNPWLPFSKFKYQKKNLKCNTKLSIILNTINLSISLNPEVKNYYRV
jgi:hypothetical protein